MAAEELVVKVLMRCPKHYIFICLSEINHLMTDGSTFKETLPSVRHVTFISYITDKDTEKRQKNCDPLLGVIMFDTAVFNPDRGQKAEWSTPAL